ncbi:MAG: leucyl aminopeptidase [Myxococcota bacterium]
MKISVSGAAAEAGSSHIVALGVFEKGRAHNALIKKIKGGAQAVKRHGFTGKKGQVVEVATGGAYKAWTVLFVGLGAVEDFDRASCRRFAAIASRHAQGLKAASLALTVPAPDDMALVDAVEMAAQGVMLGTYRFERYKTGERQSAHELTKVSLHVPGKVGAPLRDAVSRGQAVAEAVTIARDLINTPPNDLYPDALASIAKDLAKQHKGDGLSCKVFNHAQIKAKGMNLLDAVGRGSSKGPCLIHLQYRPPGSGRKKLKKLVFVGKGITFDTGGICLKPAPGMEEMKGDMGGSANVIALMGAVAAAQPEAEVHGIVASAENMPDGNAYRPGDIFTSYGGKTVEIINTDAEGRLALADALGYAQELEPDVIIDNATLTGAAVVALGPTVSGFFTNRPALAELFSGAAKDTGEAMWHMPLVEELRQKLDSPWADMRNVGDRWGGAITAALFLREFVGEYPWVHLDVAGPSMADKSYDIYTKGGTGHGVLTYLEVIERFRALEEE